MVAVPGDVRVTCLLEEFFSEFRVASGFKGFLNKQFDGVLELLDDGPDVKDASASQHNQ